MGSNLKQQTIAKKLETSLKEMADLQAGIILLNEHNSDTKKMEVREGYRIKLLK